MSAHDGEQELRGGLKRFRLPLLLVGGAIALLLGDRRFGSAR